MPYILLCVGAGAGLTTALCVWFFLGMLLRPRVSIDNRIYYQPVEMRYSYCIKITNKSKLHCLCDLEFSSDLVCVPVAAEEGGNDEKEAIPEMPLLQILALPDACLRPSESHLYYLYLAPPQTLLEDGECENAQDVSEQEQESAYSSEDFRSVFRKSRDAELQVLLKCKHGYSGKTRIFYKKFLKKDFYNHLKLEA